DRTNMPGSQREVGNAEDEGADFVWLSTPEAFEAAETIQAVRAARMRLGTPDASGRRTPEIEPGEGFRLDADMVITALGSMRRTCQRCSTRPTSASPAGARCGSIIGR